VVYQDDRMVGIIGDRAGQLGENGEYGVGRKGKMENIGWVGMNKYLNCTDTYRTYGIPKLSSIVCR
jgi:hypothetical protein